MTTEVKIRYEETGEVRPPREGEWFRGNRGQVECARFDFHATEFPILTEIVERQEMT